MQAQQSRQLRLQVGWSGTVLGGWKIVQTSGYFSGCSVASPLFWSFLPSPAPPLFQQSNKEALACSNFVTSSIFDLRAIAIMKWHTQPKCMSPLYVVTRSNGKQCLIFESISDGTFFSHGLSQSTDGPGRPGWPHVFSWPCQRLPPGGFGSQILHLPWISMGGWVLCFQSPSFRSCFCPLVLHKNYENHLFILALLGGPAYKLLGWLPFPGLWFQSTAHRQLVLDTFKSAGLTINESKSHLQFTRLLTHLGFIIDLDPGSLHSGAYLPLTVLQATPILYLTGLILCCGAQVQSVSMRLLKEIDQNILIGASHLSTWFHRSYPSFGNSVQPPSLSYLSGHLALGGLYCLKDSTSFLMYTVVACYHA